MARAAIEGRDLAKSVEPLFALDLAPGMAVAVVRGGELVYAAGFGVADVASGRAVTPETLFYVASTTKSFAGTEAALLDRRGVIALDAPIHRYLPALRLQAPLSPDAITVRDLLAMTHGIENDGPVVFRTAYSGVFDHDLLLSLLQQPLAHPKTSHVGAYENEELGRMEWRLEGEVLNVRIGPAERDTEIFDAATDRFRAELTGGGEVVQFGRRGVHFPPADRRVRWRNESACGSGGGSAPANQEETAPGERQHE